MPGPSAHPWHVGCKQAVSQVRSRCANSKQPLCGLMLCNPVQAISFEVAEGSAYALLTGTLSWRLRKLERTPDCTGVCNIVLIGIGRAQRALPAWHHSQGRCVGDSFAAYLERLRRLWPAFPRCPLTTSMSNCKPVLSLQELRSDLPVSQYSIYSPSQTLEYFKYTSWMH